MALCMLAACSDAPTGASHPAGMATPQPRASLAQAGWTTIEDFESGTLAAYAVVGPAEGSDVDAAYARDGANGLATNGSAWLYRTDAAVQVAPGDKVSAWVMFDDVVDGRAYVGVGATTDGALSLTLEPTSGAILFQEITDGYNKYSNDLGAAAHSFVPDRWYRAEVVLGMGGTVVGNLYDSDGTTLLSTLTVSSPLVRSGGIAFRAFGGVKAFDTVQRFASTGNTTPVADAGGPYEAGERTEILLNAAGSIDADGDALSYAWDLDGDGAYDDATGATTSVMSPDDDTYTVSVQVTDAHGASSTASATVTVNNVAPSIASIDAVNIASGLAEPIKLVSGAATARIALAFSDPAGAADTYGAVIDCGNSTTANATSITSPHTGSTCTYTTAGVYTVKATVADEDGGKSAQAVHQYVVVYDPSAGFVTGGGWILYDGASCAVLCGGTAGRADFGFVSKYQKGATVPTGATRFEFHAGALTFTSTSYEWLVISGGRAQYKGSGTINGTGDYRFLLTAVDGTPDRFRIKIVDAATDAVVFDNQIGADETAPAATALDKVSGNGSIVIHGK